MGVIPNELQLECPEEDTGVNHPKACLDQQVYQWQYTSSVAFYVKICKKYSYIVNDFYNHDDGKYQMTARWIDFLIAFNAQQILKGFNGLYWDLVLIEPGMRKLVEKDISTSLVLQCGDWGVYVKRNAEWEYPDG